MPTPDLYSRNDTGVVPYIFTFVGCIIEGEKIKILRKTDIVLIVAFLIFAVMFYFIFALGSNNGESIIIKLNGNIYEEVSLNENQDIDVYLNDGTLLNTIRIQDKKAYIIYSNCPDKLCVNHKPISCDSYINDIIVCLPNRVTVEIKNSAKEKNDKSKIRFDAIIGN